MDFDRVHHIIPKFNLIRSAFNWMGRGRKGWVWFRQIFSVS